MSNLLNANTVNFQELIGNGRSYSVPAYQRDYSWSEEQWEDLWQDILELQPDAGFRHYMGAVVVKPETDRSFLIIDGQQRIATLTILGLAVIDALSELSKTTDQEANRERAEALRARYIGEKDPASLTQVSKLILNEHDKGFFQDYLVQLRMPPHPRSLGKSSRLLFECFRYFQKQIRGSKMAADGRAIAELLSEVVARRLMFILITVDDELSAYTVFETLNARGLEHTTTDLLKNYLFSRLKAPNDLESVQRRWSKLITTVVQERFDEFLRFHYLTMHRKIWSGRLFKMVRNDVKQSWDVLDLMTALENRSELFAAISNPSHSFWVDIPGSKRYVRDLNLFRVRQMIPLLFAAYERLSTSDFTRVLKLVGVISFRYTVISGLNSSLLEQAYSDAAQAIIAGTATTPRHIFEALRPIYVSDDKFAIDFEEFVVATSGRQGTIAKYILCCFEADASNRDCDPDSDSGSIEHILPENPADSWEESIPRERWDDVVYRIGNLTLLKSSENRIAANDEYIEKVKLYFRSNYAITRQIAEIAPVAWNVPLIEHRQKLMALRAVHIWRSDFD